jgi:hypothetical protein
MGGHTLMKKVKLTQGKYALVDNDLFEELNKVKWYALRDGKTFYAVRKARLASGKRTTLQMHRYIFELMGWALPETVDHRDRNGLNNQRANLRPATRQQQRHNQGRRTNNTSGVMGVCYSKQMQKWQASGHLNKKQILLGYFTRKRDAIAARNTFVHDHHGEFAILTEGTH